MSFSVMTGLPYFLLQTKLICTIVLTSNYWFYEFDTTSFRNFFLILDNFLSLFWFLLKSYTIITVLIALICLKKRSKDHRERLQRKAYGFNGLDNFF